MTTSRTSCRRSGTAALAALHTSFSSSTSVVDRSAGAWTTAPGWSRRSKASRSRRPPPRATGRRSSDADPWRQSVAACPPATPPPTARSTRIRSAALLPSCGSTPDGLGTDARPSGASGRWRKEPGAARIRQPVRGAGSAYALFLILGDSEQASERLSIRILDTRRCSAQSAVQGHNRGYRVTHRKFRTRRQAGDASRWAERSGRCEAQRQRSWCSVGHAGRSLGGMPDGQDEVSGTACHAWRRLD